MSLAEYESINWKYLRKTRKWWFIFPVFMLLIFVMNACSSFTSDNPEMYSNLSGSMWSLAMMLLFFGFLYYSFVRGFKKNYYNTPALAEGLTYMLSEESIITEGESTNSRQPWSSSFKQVVKIGKWMLLSSSGTTAYFLDTEKLIAPATLADVQELLRTKGVKSL